jgi:putative transposase
MRCVLSLSHDVGKKPACEALQVPRATFYRHQNANPQPSQLSLGLRPQPPQALDAQERQAVVGILHCQRFVDDTPYQIYATLLDEGQYYCSVRTMYRILTEQHGSVIERRKHVQRPAYAKPELLATGPNQVCSWDITKLKGPVKWTYFYPCTSS